MYTPVFSSKFKVDYKKASTSGHGTKDVDEVIRLLAAELSLPASHRDHALKGKWRTYRECHVRPDLLLIYKVQGEYLMLARLGSHAELFE